VTNQQDPLEQLLDLLVYAPLGLLLTARDLVPTLAERGRRHLGPQTTAARLVGEMAVSQGQRGVEHLVRRGRAQTEQLLADLLAGAPARGASARRSPGGDGRGATTPAATAAPTPPPSAAPTAVTGDRASTPPPARPQVSELAIPGYDTLSASQVVQRLEGLTPGELEAVRAYEQAGRARKTVLTRIAQLTGT
jgi:hypothetical protein